MPSEITGFIESTVSVPKQSNGGAITVAMDQLDAETSMLVEEVHMLIDRIGNVVGPELPEAGAKTPGDVAPESSNMAQFLNHESQSLRNLRMKVKSIRDRIEL